MISLTFYIISHTSASSIETSPENSSPKSPESLNNSGSDAREAWACLTRYERKDSVVQDTVYQQKCINVTSPHCILTHISATRPALETRSRREDYILYSMYYHPPPYHGPTIGVFDGVAELMELPSTGKGIEVSR